MKNSQFFALVVSVFLGTALRAVALECLRTNQALIRDALIELVQEIGCPISLTLTN
ncbi:hypothetical protein Lepto7376_4524 [[Leptolyngbya] sp. PCC 7376]|nr:hypothetical protein Lepto7376_4524 [[Leptolyngbya] sp. PCC 7376]